MICINIYADGSSIELPIVPASFSEGVPEVQKRRGADIMDVESSEFFCAEDINGCRTGGGHSAKTTYDILLDAKVNFVVALKSDGKDVFRYPEPIKNIRKFPHIQRLFNRLTIVENNNILEDVDIILYINDTSLLFSKMEDDLYNYNVYGFNLDTCTISFKVEAHNGDSHTIAGI